MLQSSLLRCYRLKLKEVNSTFFFSAAKKPEFGSFGPFYLFEGSEGRLKCEPDAAPPPEFRWFKGDKEITAGESGYKMLSDGTLVIDQVTKDDAGQYRCSANNFMGSASATALANILSKDVLK